ncbi:MAG: hypothetical protein NVSMB66_1640 [Candidatus Doudnabacteria bacterium]
MPVYINKSQQFAQLLNAKVISILVSMTAQHIFYILGSVTFGAFILFLLAALAILLSVAGQIKKISQRINSLTDEVHGMIEAGKSYGKTMGSVGLLTKIIRAFRK